MLSKLVKLKYLESPYTCPYCGSDDISAGHTTSECTQIWQIVECNKYKKRWQESYTLTDIEEES